MRRPSAALGRIRHLTAAVIATAVVYASSPEMRVGSNASPPGSVDRIYVQNFGSLATIDPFSGAEGPGPLLSGTDCYPSASHLPRWWTDQAPDGSVYGFVDDCATGTWWGRVDPDSGAVTPLELSPVTIARSRPAFVQNFSVGSPIGYRFDRYPDDSKNVTLYAVDSLFPYEEHLFASITPAVRNFGLGTVVTPDGSRVFYVTQDGVYEFVPPATLQQIGFLGVVSLTTNAALLNFDSGGTKLRIANGDTVMSFDVQSGLVEHLQLFSLGSTPSAFMRRGQRGGVRIEPHHGLITDELGGTAKFTAVLTSPPIQNVSVSFSQPGTLRGTLSNSSLSFKPGNWNVPQTITITGVDDGVVDGPHPYTIVTSNTVSTDPAYQNKSVLDISVTNAEGGSPTIAMENPIAQARGTTASHLLASVDDAEDSPAALLVSVLSAFPGLAIGPLMNTNGSISGAVTVQCDSPLLHRAFDLDVEDSAGNHRRGRGVIAVGTHTAPVLDYAAATIAAGDDAVLLPTAFDAGVESLAVTAPGFTGSITADASTGALTVTNATPPGDYTVEVSGPHRCAGGPAASASFALTVTNEPPGFTPAVPTIRAGDLPSLQILGNATDLETEPALITVTATSVPDGITLGTIVNEDGEISAPMTAACEIATGQHTLTLQVTDAHGASISADVTIEVLENEAPLTGPYPAGEVRTGGAVTIAPAFAPGDAGPFTMSVDSPTFNGTLDVDQITGVVSAGDAGPAGTHNIIVFATDECGLATERRFALNVSCSFAIEPAFRNVSAAAGTGNILVRASPGCAWTTEIPAGRFLSVAGNTSGTGDGVVSYDFESNATPLARSTSLSVAGLTFTLMQNGSGATPFAMNAVAGNGNVSLAWSPAAGTTVYEVHRREGSGAFGLVATTGALSHNDGTIANGNGYLYRVHAVSGSGVIAMSNVDMAVPFAYTDAIPITAKAVHFLELRAAIDAGRAAAGLPPAGFHELLATGGTIRASHLLELRQATVAMRAALGLPPIAHAPVNAGSTTILRTHVTSLRAATQ